MEDVKRERALRYLNITGVSQCIVGVLLLILGVVSRFKHGPYMDGIPPFYTGAFIGMAMVLVQAVLGLAVFIRGKDCVNKLEAAEKIGCIMQTYCLMAIATNVGYLVAVLVVSFTGVCLNSDCSYIETRENRRLAITIIVFICVGVLTSAIGLAIVCKFSSSFGLKMLSRAQYQISNMVDNTDDVIAYIAAEQTAGTNITENETHHHHHHSHPDPRLAFPEPDFSTTHLQHYLTQQYRDRIRKRRKKNRKRNRQSNTENENRRRRQEREAPYVLPPVTGLNYHEREAPYVLPPVSGHNFYQRSRSPTRTPPPPPPSPPPASMHYPPPSPSPPLTQSPPQSRRTPPLTPSALPLPDIIPPRYSPQPQSSGTPSPPPPTPPLHQPAIIHVIPCGETFQDEPPPYSP
ncbi:uncharacterized protein LOC132745045 [Ruditapes philippinarum]|uniref:uncharacterized protein LOC132745045 n=1 Tax=Ruditapes philippinarum TaxID=129788 RepID=UPI00295C0178|nr:uncharacterized protein LOC132745045 [Ruditapes philippinarum]